MKNFIIQLQCLLNKNKKLVRQKKFGKSIFYEIVFPILVLLIISKYIYCY